MRGRWLGMIIAAGAVLAVVPASGDVFTYLDDEQQTHTVEGTLIASGRGFHVVGRADGQYQLIAQERLQKRDPGDAPAPISPAAMRDLLYEAFGEDRIRVQVEDSFVIGLVLAGPLPDRSTSQVDGFLLKASRFMRSVELVFSRFARELRLQTARSEYPLVMLVFETDQDFNDYARQVTGGRGLAAENMAGFYSPLSNWLAIRIGECRSFKVPLHEAIHQQVYNRGLLQRLAGVPVWFNEGIATGFENDGERIDKGPIRVSAHYAPQVSEATSLSWQDVFDDDSAFTGSVLAGEAYVHAWSMHWLLVNQHRRNYAKYFQLLGTLKPLEELTPAERELQFSETFGRTISQMHAGFPQLLRSRANRQGIDLSATAKDPGVIHGDACQVELTSVQQVGEEGLIEIRGELLNVSPFRDFAYLVTVQTDGGLYASWHLPGVESLETERLNPRLVEKSIEGSPGETGSRFWVEVICALPDSTEAEQWRRGEYPRMVWEDPAG